MYKLNEGIKQIACECGNINLNVFNRKCKNCEYNGFQSPDPDDCLEYKYDEDLRVSLEKEYDTVIERSENYDNGTCKVGEMISSECYSFECNKCNKVVMILPLLEC